MPVGIVRKDHASMARKHNATGRSARTGSFTMLEDYMLRSPAWRSLPLPARVVLIEILRLYRPGRNGRIAMSARTLATELPISRATAARALQHLVERGFIEATKLGGFNVKAGVGRSTEWRLTVHQCDVTGARASRAFMRWLPAENNSAAAARSQLGLTKEPPPGQTK